MADVVIRPPRPGDGDGLAACWMEFGASYARLAPELFQIPDPEGLAAWIEASWFSVAPAEACLLVAEADGQAVGCVTARLRRPRADAAKQVVREPSVVCVLIDLLMVREAYRRRGSGRRLMAAAEAWGRAGGAEVALLDTYADSPLSVPFYERGLGYRRRSVRFRKTLA